MVAVLAQTGPQLLLKELHQRLQQQPSSSIGCFGSSFQCQPLGGKELRRVGRGRRGAEIRSFWDVSKPTAVEMEAINDTEQLDDILQRAQGDETSNSVIIDWMASWCRKCIYLKPKLEKLAADFPKVKFYYVDVNKVSQALVKRGNISKMPTIQLWKDGEMREEVVGGHKAWLVVEEVKEMIQKYN